jgi:hypothetical protein
MHWQWQNNWAVRQGDWKLIRDKRNKKIMTEDELFLGNLSDPVPEGKNYVEERPDLVDSLTRLHEAWAKEVLPPAE